MKKIRTLIVDDEPLAREKLRKLVEREETVEVIGEAGNGKAAVEMIQQHKPDLVFLDVQMPELNGFDVLARLEPQGRPAIIFVTAHDKFALKAFEVHALDYLLKPFDRDRLKTALDRAIQQIRKRDTAPADERLEALLATVKPSSTALDRIAVKTAGRVLLVKTSEIDWVGAADNYVELHVGKETHLLRETMTALEAKLNPEKFYRISRSTIVNIDRVKEMQPLFHGDYTVTLSDGTQLTMSRNFRERLAGLLGNEA